MPRPHIDLDPVREGIDRALSHPWGQLAARLFPRAAAEVRAAADNLPAIASQAQEQIGTHVREEIGALEDEAISTVKSAWRGALRSVAKGRRRR